MYIETSSYDTIGNAFFARTVFTDVRDWRRVLVVTSRWHMDRTKQIFDWVFSAPSKSEATQAKLGHKEMYSYHMRYLMAKDSGMDEHEISDRASKEVGRMQRNREHMQKYKSLCQISSFLNEEHGMYNIGKIMRTTVAHDQPGMDHW